MWSNKRTSRVWSKWSNKRASKAWSNERTNAALIMGGCFLLAGLAGYRLGYRRGMSRHTREAITTAPPSNVTVTAATQVEPEQGIETETHVELEKGSETEPLLETEQGNGQRVRSSPEVRTTTVLSEELGTQQLFSQIVPYLRRNFYVEQ
jgi:hypothetical protein